MTWYQQNRRDLPWRGESSPYRVWVSEVLLQQTQVATVVPYYQRFMERFPTVADVSAAPLADVLKMWEGLGYYARARYLHQAAMEIVTQYGGQLPNTYAELRRLPGFGEYTAGAVASIAFGEAVAAIDGNVKRVLSRLFAIQTSVTRQLKQIARELVEQASCLLSLDRQDACPTSPGDWNQALIELGALVCLPKTPRCATCPLNELCQAHQQGLEHVLPLKPVKKKLPHYDVSAAVICQAGQYLIAQRPLKGMLGGLWEFPGGKQESGETLSECLQREIREELGLTIEVEQPIISIKHSYTHFKITLHAFYCHLTEPQTPQTLQVADWQWVTLADMANFAFPRTDLKIIAALQQRD